MKLSAVRICLLTFTATIYGTMAIQFLQSSFTYFRNSKKITLNTFSLTAGFWMVSTSISLFGEFFVLLHPQRFKNLFLKLQNLVIEDRILGPSPFDVFCIDFHLLFFFLYQLGTTVWSSAMVVLDFDYKIPEIAFTIYINILFLSITVFYFMVNRLTFKLVGQGLSSVADNYIENKNGRNDKLALFYLEIFQVSDQHQHFQVQIDKPPPSFFDYKQSPSLFALLDVQSPLLNLFWMP